MCFKVLDCAHLCTVSLETSYIFSCKKHTFFLEHLCAYTDILTFVRFSWCRKIALLSSTQSPAASKAYQPWNARMRTQLVHTAVLDGMVAFLPARDPRLQENNRKYIIIWYDFNVWLYFPVTHLDSKWHRVKRTCSYMFYVTVTALKFRSKKLGGNHKFLYTRFSTYILVQCKEWNSPRALVRAYEKTQAFCTYRCRQSPSGLLGKVVFG